MDKKKYFAFAGVCGKLSVVGVALVAVLFMSQPSKAYYNYSGHFNELCDSTDKIAAKLDTLIKLEKEQNELLKQIKDKLVAIEDNQW